MPHDAVASPRPLLISCRPISFHHVSRNVHVCVRSGIPRAVGAAQQPRVQCHCRSQRHSAVDARGASARPVPHFILRLYHLYQRPPPGAWARASARRCSWSLWFDVACLYGRVEQDEDNTFFMQEIKRLKASTVELEVFNAKNGTLRGLCSLHVPCGKCACDGWCVLPAAPAVVQLTPDQHRGTGYLGLFVRFDTYTGTRENVLRVLVCDGFRDSTRGGAVSSLGCLLCVSGRATRVTGRCCGSCAGGLCPRS
jgi:hypothetical protein